MDPREFHKRLFDCAVRHIRDGAAVVCGVSGGADSMALLHGLHSVNGLRRCGWRLHVAHLNHGLRPDAGLDADFVADAARRLGLHSTIQSLDVAAGRRAGETIEEAGRRLRYGFLEETAGATGAQIVAVAHHADDQAETVLHRIARGTGLGGLAGMREQRPIPEGGAIRLVRPLLEFRRAELRAYLEARGVPFRDDPTNKDPDAGTRNRIRHLVLPQLERLINPDIVSALCRLAKQAERADEAIRQFAEEALNRVQISRTPEMAVLSAEAFAALPRAVQTQVVMITLRRLGAGLQAVGFERIDAAADMAASADGAGRVVELPGGFVIERRGPEVRFRGRNSL